MKEFPMKREFISRYLTLVSEAETPAVKTPQPQYVGVVIRKKNNITKRLWYDKSAETKTEVRLTVAEGESPDEALNRIR